MPSTPSPEKAPTNISPSLSVVIPVYNEPHWIVQTYESLVRALDYANLQQVEIIVIDDGSGPETINSLRNLSSKYQTRIVRNSNQGRLLARKSGLQESRSVNILLLDSRTDLAVDSVANLVKVINQNHRPDLVIFDVDIDTNDDLLNSFWKIVTRVAWRTYYENPKPTLIVPENFDLMPKGTTCLFGKREVLMHAHANPKFVVTDLRYANDDTLILREISATNSILLDPSVRCTYHGRKNSVKMSMRHTFHRGTVFATGYLHTINRYSVAFVTLVTASLAAVILLSGNQFLIPMLASTGLVLIFVAALVASRSLQDSWRFLLVLPCFVVVYALGIFRGLLLMLKARI